MSDDRTTPQVRSLLLANLLTFLASVTGVAYGLFIARPEDNVVAIAWPASAVAFTVIALYGWRLFPGVAAGTFVAAILDKQPLVGALALMLPTAIEVAIARALIRPSRIDLQFRSSGDSIRLALIAALGSMGGAACGVLILFVLGELPRDGMLRAFGSWSLGDAIGILAFGPPLLLWLQNRDPIARPRRLEFAAMIAGTLFLSGFVLFSYELGTSSRVVAMWIALFPMLLWMSVRAELRVAAVLVAVLTIAATLGVWHGTGALASPSGAVRVVDVQAFHVMTVLMVLVGASSMSARERALRRSQDTERKLSLVFEGTRDAQVLYEIGADGEPRVLMANRAWLSAMAALRGGTGERDLLGRTVDENRRQVGGPAETAAAHRARMDEAITRGDVVVYEMTAPSPIGERSVLTTLVPMREGERTQYLLSTARDVTETRASERQLRESEVRFAAVSDATHEVQHLFVVGRDGELRLVHHNRAARELQQQLWPTLPHHASLGLSAEMLLRGWPGFTDTHLERNLGHARDASASGLLQRFEEPVVVGGDESWWEVTLLPITNEHGAVTHVLRSSVEISDRKRAEETARRFSADLERRVLERTAQLAMANTELEAFGYSLSHDLRAPLRSVEGFSRALLEDLEGGETAHARDHARRIHQAALRMQRLVDDLLRLSQLSTQLIERTMVDVSAMAGEIAREIGAAQPARQVAVTIDPGMRSRADARLVAIALHNLLDNAWKYTARRDDGAVHVGHIRDEAETRIFVRDNGVGFDPRYAARLFTPFQRLHKPEEFEGAGIGLATVHRVIAAHGGRVWAESAPGEGATFWFTLEPDPRAATPTG
ncbi:MAG: MASE1 domain-containing protein [Gemmatimonadaceae bacterium]|nr:MASE1 domain-containing protein [Gemmatimonadaceae bacterium]